MNLGCRCCQVARWHHALKGATTIGASFLHAAFLPRIGAFWLRPAQPQQVRKHWGRDCAALSSLSLHRATYCATPQLTDTRRFHFTLHKSQILEHDTSYVSCPEIGDACATNANEANENIMQICSF